MNQSQLLDVSLLDELEQRWRALSAPVADILQPGLAADEIDRQFSSLGLRAPMDAKTWWGWHNGVPAPPAARLSMFGPSFSFFSLESAVSGYERAREDAQWLSEQPDPTDSEPDRIWHPQWFILTRGGGDLILDCSVPAGETTPIRYVNWAQEYAGEIVVPTFRRLIELVIEAFDAGVWEYEAVSGQWQHHRERTTAEQRATGLF